VKGYEKWNINELAGRIAKIGKRVISEKANAQTKLIE
jgi:hypothetical protein